MLKTVTNNEADLIITEAAFHHLNRLADLSEPDDANQGITLNFTEAEINSRYVQPGTWKRGWVSV